MSWVRQHVALVGLAVFAIASLISLGELHLRTRIYAEVMEKLASSNVEIGAIEALLGDPKAIYNENAPARWSLAESSPESLYDYGVREGFMIYEYIYEGIPMLKYYFYVNIPSGPIVWHEKL